MVSVKWKSTFTSIHASDRNGVRCGDRRVFHGLQCARGAEERADFVGSEITVLHLEENRVEGERLDDKTGEQLR